MFSNKKDRFQNTNNTTRGGQVWAHQIRMGWQVFKTSSLVALLPAVLVWSWSCISNVSGLGLYLWILSFWAEIKLAISGVFFNGIATISFFKGGVWVMRDAGSFVHNPYVREQVWRTESAFRNLLNADSIFWGLVSFLFFVIVCLVFFRRKGGDMEEEVVMEGQSIAPKKEVARAVKREGASSLEIAPGLPIPKNSETKHFMVLGTTGSGKTNVNAS
ncbi:MAG: type IV secretion system DNA-binding domain-containing protein [bacterium]|nr:type IV secretion system DNA-binding domain-containing protein [bacterium]